MEMIVLQVILEKKIQAGPLKALGTTIDMENNVVKGVERVDGAVLIRHSHGFTEVPLQHVASIDYLADEPKKK